MGVIRLGGYLSREGVQEGGTARDSAVVLELPLLEGTARGFPVLRDADGAQLADGDFVQWANGEQLHVKIVYDFDRDRRIEENAVFRQRPALIQEEWSFEEIRDGELFRRFEVNFSSGTASASKRDENEVQEWSEEVDIEPGRTFAGFGFALAIKALRERLIEGEEMELQAVGFTPEPRTVSVAISHGGLEEMRMAGRVLRGNRFVIQPQIPWIARLFVTVPDTRIWLTHPTPAGFLRWEGPLAEPDDPIVRVDLLPGTESGPARPVERANVAHKRPEPSGPLPEALVRLTPAFR
jgi:hypothetical protein